MQQHGAVPWLHALFAPPRSSPQPAARLLLLLGALLALIRPLSASAAPASPPPPAGDAEMTLYSGIAAVNVCVARGAGVEFDQAVAIAGETIAQLIQSQHGSVISLVGNQPLSLDDLRKGSINSAVLGAVEACPDKVPDAVRKAVQASLRQAQGAAQPAPVANPSRSNSRRGR
jgi:hypothetical protein